MRHRYRKLGEVEMMRRSANWCHFGWSVFLVANDPNFRTDYETVSQPHYFALFEPDAECCLFYVSSRDGGLLTCETYWPGVLQIDDRRKHIFYGPLQIEHLPDQLPFVINLRNAPDGQLPASTDRRFIYFLQAKSGGPIKIGFSVAPLDRMRSLQTASPTPFKLLAAIPGSCKLETHLKKERFRSLHIHGEWFEPASPLLDYIAALQPETA